MRITEIDFGGARPVDGYGPGFFRIAGQRYDGALVLLPSGPQAWGGFGDVAPFLAARSLIDVVLVGTGPEITAVPAGFRDALTEAGLGVEFMASAPACRTFNVLLAEGRRIAAALLPI
jgi:uncharacterized protein